jgi:hypothetical protein
MKKWFIRILESRLAEGFVGWHAHEAEINLSPTDHGIVAHRR